MNGKRLTKSRDNRMICGVCGGIAEYFGIDPTVVRLALAVFCLAGGSGILAYIIAAIVMPEV
jgi:phage shock protein C